jgi:hypothetical protein
MADEILYRVKIEGFSDASKGLADLRTLSIEYRQAISESQKEVKAFEKQLAALQKETSNGTKATSEQTKQMQELSGKITDTNTSIEKQKEELSKVNAEKRQAQAITAAYNKVITAEIGSNDQLKAQLKILTAEYNSMSAEQRNSAEVGGNLKNQILSITNELKKNESAIGDNRRNVGNYEKSITDALGKINIMGVNLGQLTTQFKAGIETGQGLANTFIEQATAARAQALATTSSATASGVLSGALKVVRVALISTGIGAIVVALGALAAGFLSTQRGADAFSRALTPVRFIFERLLGLLQELSFGFVDFVKSAFQDPLKVIKDFGEGFIKFVTNPIQSVKGIIDGVKASFKELRSEIGRAAREGKEFANLQIELKDAQIASKQALARLNVEIAKNRDLASDQLATDEERIVALQKAKKAIEDKYNLEADLIAKEIKLKELQFKQNDTDRELQLELEDLIASQIQLQAFKLSEQKRITSQLSGLLKKEKEDVEAVTEAIIDKSKTQIEILQDEIKAQQEATRRKLINLEFERNKQLEVENLTAENRLAIERKFQQDKIQIQTDALIKQAADIKAQLEPILADSGGSFINPLTDEEEAILKEQLNTINAEIAKISGTINGVEGEVEPIDLLNGLGLTDDQMSVMLNSLDILKNAISAISNVMAEVTKRNTELIKKQVEEGVLSQEEADKKISDLEKKNFKRQKLLQLGLAGIDAAKAIIASLAQSPIAIGPVPNPVGIASLALATSSGIASIASIAAQKFNTGGFVSGPGTKTSDSIPAWLSNGEFVQRAAAVDYYGTDFMQAINNLQVPKFSTGGLVTPTGAGSTAAQVQAGVAELSQQVQSQEIRVINVESDFSNIQNRVNNVEQARTF